MSTRIKYFVLFMVAQAGCVAAGLWMQHHYLVSSTYRAAKEEAWSAMETRASTFLARLASQRLPPSTPANQLLERTRASLAAELPKWGDALLIDQEWRVVGQLGDVDENRTSHLSPGHRISWSPLSDKSEKSGGAMQGILAMPEGPHLALACALRNQQAYVLFHLPVADIALSPSRFTESLLALGGVTFLWICALLAFLAYMVLARLYDLIERERTTSAADALRQTQTLVRTRDAVIFGLAKLAESRDPETGDHLERICAYSTTLASALRGHPKFREEITPAFVKLIGISAALHDIGKVGIEDRILCKRGPLSPAERLRMQAHATIGGQCLGRIERRLGSSNFLQMASEIALAHHERWDGTGYPKGLAGDAIPLSARIVAVADVYDALVSRRVYKDQIPHAGCVDIIRSEAGKQFDPLIVEIWLAIEGRFLDTARQYGSSAPDDAGIDIPIPEAQSPQETATGCESETLVAAAPPEPSCEKDAKPDRVQRRQQ